ncbi:hypothetical protein AG0111_0g1550 [Alternaria gaisen]|uniref:Uncharacterized protein n=1 Tax=Alternaria gaisen TaxID=167740 RepID=A0ACB6G3K1_9PLEO|nr:hypothetical protein AG0111_0g1550 [Alternaria gaisen]
MPYLRTRIRKLHREAEKDKGEGESINRYNTVRLSPPPDDKFITLDWVPHNYKYKFGALPRQDDPVISEILGLIRSLNGQNIEVANMRFRVSPTDESLPFWLALPDYTTYCSKLFTFIDDYHEFPLTAWVTFSPGLPGPAADNLCLKIGTKWVLLKDWLLSSYKSVKRLSDGSGLVGEKGYRAQRKWWKLNGKHFRLFDLPAEVRMTVFGFALGPRIYPMTKGDSVCLGRGFPNWLDMSYKKPSSLTQLFKGDLRVTGCSAHEPNIALLSVNRQTHIEALQAGWENTRKCFFSPKQFDFVLTATTKPSYNWLNHVIFDFTMEGWFDVLELENRLNREMRHHSYNSKFKSFSTVLSTLEKLSTLQLWFRSPDDGVDQYPSWVRIMSWRRVTNNLDDDDIRMICCQRTMVDWIMTFAWPCVKDLRAKVVVGGILKKDTKDKWNELLALSAQDKLRVIDQEAAEQAIFNTPLTLL